MHYRGHLYRHHMIYPCQRCKEIFQNQEEVGRHLKEVIGCGLRNIEVGDGITNEIVEQLKCKKSSYRGESEGEKWQRIYVLLFPSSEIPSPCKLCPWGFAQHVPSQLIPYIQILNNPMTQRSWKSTKNTAAENSLAQCEPRSSRL